MSTIKAALMGTEGETPRPAARRPRPRFHDSHHCQARRALMLNGVPYLEERIDTVETDITEIKDRLGLLERSVGNIEKNTAVMRDDIAGLKAGQIEIRGLLARVVGRLEGVDA
ncbi:hypothetical protein [Streptosporangium sp. NPDC087985]|uniref:hypothetical protein n=1 Tax=Streptosporangium sp. NPDC087985 TaxID=3366196 RepID=UPI003825A48A